MNKYSEIVLENIEVWAVKVEGVQNSAVAFNKLESSLPSLRGRKFYGCLSGDPGTGIYRACVEKNESENFKDLETWIIPGGKYLRAKIKDWPGKEKMIGEIFRDMARNCSVNDDRPCIEFYRSQRELVLLLPIKI